VPDLHKTLLDAALVVCVDQPKRDPKIFGDSSLRLSTVIDRIERIEDDPVLSTLGPLLHQGPLLWRPYYRVHAVNVKPRLLTA
jgi:hypothetical protein